jgi:hypothetical protein
MVQICFNQELLLRSLSVAACSLHEATEANSWQNSNEEDDQEAREGRELVFRMNLAS